MRGIFGEGFEEIGDLGKGLVADKKGHPGPDWLKKALQFETFSLKKSFFRGGYVFPGNGCMLFEERAAGSDSCDTESPREGPGRFLGDVDPDCFGPFRRFLHPSFSDRASGV